MTAAARAARAPQRDRVTRIADAEPAIAQIGLPLRRPARVHARRPRRRLRPHRGRARDQVERGLAASPIGQVLVEESVLGLGRVRARGGARPRRQRRGRLLDREPRSDGRPHRRLGTVAPQQTLTDKQYQELRDAAIAVVRAVGVDTGGSNVQFARDRARRRAAGDRDEPARVALLERARLQGDRLPDRQGRRAARGRLHAPRDPQRPHAGHAGELRAGARLRASSSSRGSRSRSSPASTGGWRRR